MKKLLVFLFLFFFFGFFSAADAEEIFYRTLKKGMTGDDVKTLQEILAKDPAVYPEGIISSYFGEATERALGKFQEKEGIVNKAEGEENGYGTAGPRTRETLKKYLPSEIIEEAKSEEKTTAEEKIITPPVPVQEEAKPEEVAEETPKPFLVEISVSNKGEYRAYIGVKSERLAKMEVEYGESGSFDKIKLISRDLMFSLGDYLDNLEIDKVYSIRAKATDKNGIISYSEEMTFSLTSENDPAIITYGPAATVRSLPDVFVEIIWETNLECEGTVYYGKTADYGKTAAGKKEANHRIILTGLEPGVWYYKTSCFIGGRTTESGNASFIVPETSSLKPENNFSASAFSALFEVFSSIFSIFK
ncbi:MAG: peptidoglycan-binding domain-containing protein [Candidatus Paceibacterota bacterium]